MHEKHIEDDSLKIWLEQYRSVREEIITSFKNQQSTLQWSSVSVGGLLLLAYYLRAAHYEVLTFVVFLVFLPCVAIMFLNIWIGEVGHTIRNSTFLFHLEDMLSYHLPKTNNLPLFEHWLRNGDKHIKSGYISSVAIYMGLIATGHILANVMIYSDNIIPGKLAWKILFTGFTIMFDVYINMGRYELIKKYILKPAKSEPFPRFKL